MSVTSNGTPQLIELVGPAGAGKTAVLRALAARAPMIRTGIRIDRVRQLPAVAWHALALTPATVDMLFTDARWLWPGLRHLGRLRAIPAEVERARMTGPRAIVLDEGPVFSLGRLAVFQHASDGAGWLARQWSAELERWTGLLNGVVLLDAPNDVLADRIRQRPKAHQVKDSDDRQIRAFLDRYRAAYQDIVNRLTAAGQVRMVAIDTATASVQDVARDILAVMDSWGMRSDVATADRGM